MDINKTGHESESMDLDSLLASQRSTINFHPDTDVTDFLKGKNYDLVVLRHPGPVWLPEQLTQWQSIVDSISSTHPATVVFSTYDHVIEDPQVKQSVGLQDQSEIREYDVFNALLKQKGYQEEAKRAVMEDLLLTQ